MAGRAVHKPTRQVKTLGTLVLSMTLGTLLLNWIFDLTPKPATALRSVPPKHPWDRILVHTAIPRDLRDDGTPRGFYHFHVDADGRINEGPAWRAGRPDPHAAGAIRVAVSLDAEGAALTPRQWKRLTDLLASLQSSYDIPRDRVALAGRSGVAGTARDHDRQLNAMLRTR